MSEYILDLTAFDNETLDDGLREEIVRCRDCKYFDLEGELGEVHPDYWCDKLTVYMPTDGFCSFGKRKEGGE